MGQTAPYLSSKRACQLSRRNSGTGARVCQGRQGRLLLPGSGEVQDEVRDVRLQRQGEPRRGQYVADRLRAEGVDCRRRGKDRRTRGESGQLGTELRVHYDVGKVWSNNPSLRNTKSGSGPLPRVESEIASMQF